MFAVRAANENTRSYTIDLERGGHVSIATLTPSTYRIQPVLDCNGDYNFAGRGPGDLVSTVLTVHFPLSSMPTIQLDHTIPPDTDQFDTTELPPVAAEQIAASRPRLHDKRIPSKVLTRSRGER